LTQIVTQTPLLQFVEQREGTFICLRYIYILTQLQLTSYNRQASPQHIVILLSK